MTAAALVRDLRARGVELVVVEGRLRVDAPSGVLRDADRARLFGFAEGYAEAVARQRAGQCLL